MFWGLPRTPPRGLQVELTSAKVEVFDPDLVMVAWADAIPPLPVYQDIYFPNLQVTFNKGGTYVFLISARDNQYPGQYITNKAWEGQGHEIRPLLQANQRIDCDVLHILIDPGHGAGSEKAGTHGCWYSIVPPGEQPNTNRYPWDEKDMVLKLGLELRRSLVLWYGGQTSKPIVDIRMSRESDAGKKLDKRVEWANEIAREVLENDPDAQLRFISLHCNGNQDYRYVKDFVAWRKTADSLLADSVVTGLGGDPPVPMTYDKEFHRYVVLTCIIPAVLVETCTLTNPDEEDWVRWQSSEENIRRLADRLRDGILLSFN